MLKKLPNPYDVLIVVTFVGCLFLLVALSGCAHQQPDNSAEIKAAAEELHANTVKECQQSLVYCDDEKKQMKHYAEVQQDQDDYALWVCQHPDQEKRCQAECHKPVWPDYNECYWLCVKDKPKKPGAK